LTLGVFTHARCRVSTVPLPPLVAECADPVRHDGPSQTSESGSAVYAIVRSGAGQQKVSVGDVIEIDRVSSEIGESVTLPVVLLVDGDQVTTAADKLAKASV